LENSIDVLNTQTYMISLTNNCIFCFIAPNITLINWLS